jgi:thymidylate kinase
MALIPVRPQGHSSLLVITGASGAGKTAAVRALDARRRQEVRCFYFDDIGVPSVDEMKRQWGSPEGWQASATHGWIERLAALPADGSVNILDGQIRPSLVEAARSSLGLLPIQVLLLDCGPKVRRNRLEQRGQPDLANEQMNCWAAYLRGQADALGLAVIATDKLTIDQVADAIEEQVGTMLKRRT